MLQRLLDAHGITGGHAGPPVSATPRTTIPTTMSAGELMQALNLKPWVFFKHQRAGKCKRFEFKRPIGHKHNARQLHRAGRLLAPLVRDHAENVREGAWPM